MAGGWLDKIKDAVKGNPQQADSALGKVEDLIDKQTGGKYADQVERGSDALRDQLGLPKDDAGVPDPGPEQTIPSTPAEPVPAPEPEPASAPEPEPVPAPEPEPVPAPEPEPAPAPEGGQPEGEQPDKQLPPFGQA